MVGGGGVQVARLQPAPQKFLVALGAKGRAHDVSSRGSEVRVAVHAIVKHQMAGQNFAVDPLAACACARNGLG